MHSSLSNKSHIAFAVGTGRCGTQFLSKVCELETVVSSTHERNRCNETFHRYCKWYGVDVDNAGFLETKRREIKEDLRTASFSFEASSYLSLSLIELYEQFDAKFILLVRSPEKVINSYLRKGWYNTKIVRNNPNLPPSFQESVKPHHFFSRLMPSGNKYIQWSTMSRVGQLAWFWNALNSSILKQFEHIPSSHWSIEKLEELSYGRYLQLAEFIGFQSSVSAEDYNQLVDSRPNSLDNVRSVETWTAEEIKEFEQEVAPMAQHFGYGCLAKTRLLKEDHQKMTVRL